ncbi:MAG: DUF4293 family protein [Brumimicrobium sp.]
MIQRVQSFYLLLTLIALVFLTLGEQVFESKVVKPDTFILNSHANVFGIQRDINVIGDLEASDEEVLKQALDKVEVPENTNEIPTFYFPFYSITILLSMLTVVVFMSYKNLKRQLKFGRMLFVFNFLVFVVTVVIYYIFKSNVDEFASVYTVNTTLGFGFYCIAIATAFSFLANIGIRRDLRLIQSIDRIR